MFDIGLSEICVVILVGCLVIDPKKIPHVIKELRVYYRKFVQFRSEVTGIVNKIDLDDICSNVDHNPTMKPIIGDDGQVYEAYDVKSVLEKCRERKDDSKSFDS